MIQVAVIGGGLSGLVSSILLSRAGFSVTLFEKKTYPFHRVCGEYVSNEVLPFLEKNDLFPPHLSLPKIDELQVSSTRGNAFIHPLDLGGFGISRYELDFWLSQKAKESGAQLYEGSQVTDVQFIDDGFMVKTNKGATYNARIVIGAHGKRSKLDQSFHRSFLYKRSPYVGVKYHVEADLPANRISLHNFQGGYCGVSKVEHEKFNICYMTHRDEIRKYGTLETFEKQVLYKNPHLKGLFTHSNFLFEKPEVVNELSFEQKEPVHNHVFMSGDSAGMIAPLCGNGMAMAIHSAKILSESIVTALQADSFDRENLERAYTESWNKQFAFRLWSGRKIQHLFGDGNSSAVGVAIGKYLKPVSRLLIAQTHGQPFS